LHIGMVEVPGGITRLERGDFLGYLFVAEKWQKRKSNKHLGPSLYCARGNDSGHEARNCRQKNPKTEWERGRKRGVTKKPLLNLDFDVEI